MFVFYLIYLFIFQSFKFQCTNGCLKCHYEEDEDKYTCLFCDIINQYILEDGVCIPLDYPNCLKYNLQGDCLKCKTNYYVQERACILVPDESIIENCEVYESPSVCLTCSNEHYFVDGKCMAVSIKIEGCQKYKSGNQGYCEVCSDDYLVTRDKKGCLKKPIYENCGSYAAIQCNQCIKGYSVENNYYFQNFKKQNVPNKQDFIASMLVDPEQVPIHYCQEQNIQNCLSYANGICVQCDDGFFLVKGECQKFPSEAIFQCKKYQSLTQCIECNNGFYLESESRCINVKEIEFCVSYSGTKNTTECIRCQEGYFINQENLCVIRDETQLISHCSVYHPSLVQCEQCEETYSVTTDFKKCLPYIENCSEYLESTDRSTSFNCKQCKQKYTYDTFNQQCVEDDQNCYQCEDGYYYDTQTETCEENVAIPNCKVYDRTKRGQCSVCDAEFYVFTKVNSCLKTEDIPNCIEFERSNQCKKCDKGFYLESLEDSSLINHCVEIKVENCIVVSEGLCIQCGDNYVLENGVCSLQNDYAQETCDLHNNDGTINQSSFVCNQCKASTYPRNVVGYYICTSLQNEIGSYKIENCLKYQLNDATLSYECLMCSEGYYLKNNECIEGCIEQNDIKIIQNINKIQNGDSNTYNFYQIGQIRKCETVEGINSFCDKAGINIFFQDTNYNKVDYVCVDCKEGTFASVLSKTTTNYYTNNLNSDFGGIIFTSPGVECVIPDSNNIISNNKENNLVTNCEYYYNISKITAVQKYGCIKCKYGYTGVVKHNGNDDLYPSIDICQLINDPVTKQSHGLDGDCDLSIFYQGFTNTPKEMNWNLIPIETYLSCYKCTNLNGFQYRPFIFLHFEHFDLYDSQINISYSSNTMTRFPVLDTYNVHKEISYGNGNAFRCLKLSTDSLYPENQQNLKQIVSSFNSQIPLEICALFIVNTLRYTYAVESIPNNYLVDGSVYCASCNPGFRPVVSKKIEEGGNGPTYHIPYLVSDCTVIEHCQQGGTWVNNCERCDEGYSWAWDEGLKTINYSICVQNNIKFCLAVYENQSNFECKVCQKGYEFFNGFCEQSNIPFCGDDYNFSQRQYPIQVGYVSLGRNYLSLRQFPDGCNQCREGYAAVLLRIQSNIFLNQICTYSQAILSEISTLEANYLTPNCQTYSLNASTGNLQCTSCNIGFVITTENQCQQANNIQNCAQLQKDDKGRFNCVQCQSGFIFLNKACIKGTIPNCESYNFTQTSSSQNCARCKFGFYTTGTECILGKIKYCDVYANSDTCTTCQDGYQLMVLKDETTICMEVPNDLKCIDLSPEEFKLKFINCIKCQSEFYTSPSTGEIISFCLPIEKIDNCIDYDKNQLPNQSTLKCKQCKPEYYLDIKDNICVERSFIDQNCINFEILEDKCIQCQEGYYLGESLNECIENPKGINGCRIYQTEQICLGCKEDMYLKDSQCYDVPDENKVENCIYYDQQFFCTQCIPTHYLIDRKCAISFAKNCLKAATKIECASCPEGYALNNTLDQKNCEEQTDEFCIEYKFSDPFKCLKCMQEYYPLNGICTKRKTDDIENCILYETENTCLACDVGFFLSIDQRSCDKEVYYDEYLDPFCQESAVVTPFFCSACKLGYYFKEGSCIECQNSPSKGCAYCDPNDDLKCLLCYPGYVQDKEGQCLKYNQQTNQQQDDNEIVQVNKLLLLPIMIVTLLIIFFQII